MMANEKYRYCLSAFVPQFSCLSALTLDTSVDPAVDAGDRTLPCTST